MPVRTLAALVLGLVVAVGGTASAATRAPVIRYVDDQFGPILATPKKQALYFWNVEKRDYKVHCTGTCAKLWPPLIVPKTLKVPKRYAGIKGTFGTIRRPDGRRQLTWNRLPVYTYVHEGPEQVLCDDVGGWFVVRLR